MTCFSHCGSWIFFRAPSFAEVRYDLFQEWMRETGPGGEAAGSMFEEGISGREVSANPRSSPLPSPAVVLSPELELLDSTLPALAGLALSKRSFSVCGAFGRHSWNASTRAAKTTVPKTPVASQTVSRLNLLIVSLFTEAIVVWMPSIFNSICWLQHSGRTPKK
jgi:hypothetical protein